MDDDTLASISGYPLWRVTPAPVKAVVAAAVYLADGRGWRVEPYPAVPVDAEEPPIGWMILGGGFRVLLYQRADGEWLVYATDVDSSRISVAVDAVNVLAWLASGLDGVLSLAGVFRRESPPPGEGDEDGDEGDEDGGVVH